MRKLHALTERSIVFTVRETSRSIQLLYKCILKTIYYIWIPIRETLKYIGFVIATVYKRYAYEWYLLFTINMLWMGVLGYFTIPKLIRRVEAEHHAPIEQVVIEYGQDYLYSIDTWPFSELKIQKAKLDTVNEQLIQYEFEAGKTPIPIDALLKEEAHVYGVPLEIAHAIAKHESGYNPTVFNAANRNGTLDIGVMQINSTNLGYCDLSVVEAFNPQKNIKCGMRILSNALNDARDQLARKDRIKSCTGAKDEEDLLLEYAFRVYNGGSRLLNDPKYRNSKTSCDYALKVKAIYYGVEIKETPRILQVNDWQEDEVGDWGVIAQAEYEEKEEKSFWAWLF